ncbi:MAG: MBL fold metallo-hydrolase [Butyrivibrio sp.]|nr:MBL fold metallo-hydrolase [Butyrivibrio sp.]
MKTITDRISFLPSSENPLSADVYIIRGDQKNYVVDVGSCDAAYDLISSLGKRTIIITHFHDDHMKNLRRLDVVDEELYLTAQDRRVLATDAYNPELLDEGDGQKPVNFPKLGTLVESPTEIRDGVMLVIAPIPSSHAKGSLGVIVDDEYLILGDGYYSSAKGYNVSLLSEEIKTLKALSFTRVIMSHDETVYSRDEVIAELESYYAKRTKDSPYIPI